MTTVDLLDCARPRLESVCFDDPERMNVSDEAWHAPLRQFVGCQLPVALVPHKAKIMRL
jgi:hypothetical protein